MNWWAQSRIRTYSLIKCGWEGGRACIRIGWIPPPPRAIHFNATTGRDSHKKRERWRAKTHSQFQIEPSVLYYRNISFIDLVLFFYVFVVFIIELLEGCLWQINLLRATASFTCRWYLIKLFQPSANEFAIHIWMKQLNEIELVRGRLMMNQLNNSTVVHWRINKKKFLKPVKLDQLLNDSIKFGLIGTG